MNTKAGLSLFTLSLIALVLMCGLGAFAQDQVTQQPTTSAIPNLIRYGGVLKDANGAVLASQTLGVTFALYKQQDGGVALWTETRNLTTNAAGQYSIMLGSTKPEGVTADLFSEQEQRWLGVQVQGQPEQSRVLMVSVPYAFQAHEAETLGGLPASAFVKAAADVSDGASPNAAISVNALSNAGTASSTGSSGKTKPGQAGPCASGTGFISYWNPTPTLCNSTIFQIPAGANAGFVGINQTNPSAQLDVSGAINASPTSVLNSSTGNYQILEYPVLSIGWPSQLAVVAKQNLYIGALAGAQGFLEGTGNGDTGTSNTFVGFNAAFHNQSGSDNTAVGVGAGYRNDVGSNNTYVGFDSGWTNSGSINNNTFTGWESGFNNSGSNNVFYGRQAGYNNAASGNSFYGYQAGYSNTTASGNAFFGYQAGYSGTGGFECCQNTFLGYQAGYSNNGATNTFVGYQAGYKNQNFSNTYVGFEAGMNDNLGIDNTFLGYQAGFNGGLENIFVGYEAGYNDAGTQDLLLGYQAGTYLASGALNIMIGTSVGTNNGTAANNIYIGSPGCTGTFGCAEYNTIRIGSQYYLDPNYITDTYIAGIFASTVATTNYDLVVCVNAAGGLYGAAPTTKNTCASKLPAELQKQQTVVATQEDVIKTQQEQIRSLQKQNEEFQQRLSRLESLVTTQMQTAADKSTPATPTANVGLQ